MISSGSPWRELKLLFRSANPCQWFHSPYRLVSSGADGTVQIWDCEQLKERRKPKLVRSSESLCFSKMHVIHHLSESAKLDCEPSGLSFKSQDPVFAVEGSDGYVATP